MLRHVCSLVCVGFLLLLGAASAPAQTAPRCRPSRPLQENPPPGVVGFSLSRDGRTLVAAGSDGRIRFWDVAAGEIRRTLTGHTNAIYVAVFSPDEKLLASSSRDLTARIWDVKTGRELHRLTGFKCSVKHAAFSPDGQVLAVVGNDGMLKLYDVKTGGELRSLVHSDAPDVDVSTYTAVFGRGGKRVYVGNGDGTISEWDVATGRETKVWKAHDGNVSVLTFSPDRRLLASGGDMSAPVLKLWDTATWREVRALGGQRTEGLNEQLKPVAFSADGRLIAASVVGFNREQRKYVYVRTHVWDVATGAKLFTLEGHKFDVDALVFTPDKRYLLSGSVDGVINFWDIRTGALARTLTTPRAAKAND